MTPEETAKELTEALEKMTSAIQHQVDFHERSYEEEKKLREEEKKIRDKENSEKNSVLRRTQEENRQLAVNSKERLGIEEYHNKDLKKALKERDEIEKKQIERFKKELERMHKGQGEEMFNQIQRDRFFRDQINSFKEGTNAYGGVLTTFKDLDKDQKRQIVDAAKTQQRLAMEKDKFSKTVQLLANPGSAIENYNSLSKAMGAGKESLKKLAGGGLVANASIEAMSVVAKLAGEALKGAAQAAIGMSKSLLTGERGMVVGAKATETFVKSISKVAKEFSGLAIGIGSVLILLAPLTGGLSAIAGAALIGVGAIGELGSSAAEVAAELNTFAADINDSLYKSFQDLGKLSMTGAKGMEGVKDILHTMGLTTKEFDKLKTVISNNTVGMKMFGATAEQGVKKFAEISGGLVKSELGRALELMGISAEDQYEHTAQYLTLQAKLGLLQDKNSKDLIKSTSNYIEELDKTAALTGASRKEQEDAMKAVMNIQELSAGIIADQAKIKKLEAAGASKEEIAAAKESLKEKEAAIQIAKMYQQQGQTTLAAGVAKYYGSGKRLASPEAVEFYQMGREVIKGISDLTKGNKSVTEVNILALGDLVSRAERYSSLRSIGAELSGTGGDINYAKALETKAIKSALETDEYKKALAVEKKRLGDKFDEQKFLDQYLGELAKQRRSTEEVTTRNVDAIRTQRQVAITLDNAAWTYNKTVDINKRATDLFKSAVDKFAEAAGWKGDKKAVAEPVKSVMEVQAEAQIKATRELAEPLGKRVDILSKQIDEDEKSLKNAIRTRKTAEEITALEDKVKKGKDEYSKVSQELLDAEKKTKEAAEAEKQVRKEQTKKRIELAQLEKKNEGEKQRIGDLNEKRAKLIGEGRQTTDVDTEIQKAETGIAERSGKISELKQSLAPPPGQEKKDATSLIKFQGDELGNREHYEGLNSLVRENFEKMVAEYGKPVQVNAAYRSTEEQKTLYDKWIANKQKGNPVAVPGTSRHESGRALDIQPDQVNELNEKGLLSKYGFSTISGDPPHIQMARNGGIFSGPSSGYPVMMHGREAVIPMLPDTSVLESVQKTELSQNSSNLISQDTNVGQNNNIDRFLTLQTDLMDMISNKLDALDNKLARSNDIQENILNYSAA